MDRRERDAALLGRRPRVRSARGDVELGDGEVGGRDFYGGQLREVSVGGRADGGARADEDRISNSNGSRALGGICRDIIQTQTESREGKDVKCTYSARAAEQELE